MNKFNCIIIEDEPLALERTQMYVDKIPSLILNGAFDNALEGLSFLQQNKVDILFLDINMDEISGIELLESAKIDSQIIITTAYQEYALKGYELSITDYLLKPFTFNRFLQAVNKAQKNINKSNNVQVADEIPSPTATFVFIKTEHRLEKVMIDDIIYIEGMRDYRRIHCKDKKIMTLQNFSELEKLIPNQKVCRVHKSFMVALDKIDTVEKGRIKISDQYIPISATYKDQFYTLISLNP